MRWLKSFVRFICDPGTTPQAASVKVLRDRRAYWRGRVIEAESRGDTRDAGRALMHLRAATMDELRAKYPSRSINDNLGAKA